MNKQEVKRDLYIGFGIVALGLVYFLLIGSQVHAVNDSSGLSGRQLPWLVGALTTLCGLALAFVSWRKLPTAKPGEVRPGALAQNMQRIKRVVIYTAAVALYCLGIAYIGFIVSSVAALIFLMVFSGATNKIAILLTAILSPAVIWFVFVYLIGIPMPDTLLI